MLFLEMLSKVILILVVFGIIVFFVWFLYIKAQEILLNSRFLRRFNSVRMYCKDCNRTFNNYDSIKTEVGIYPCPYCASNKTCLDTLES